MKQNMSIGLFFGILVLLVGLGIILREVFDIHIPIWRIFLGLALIYFGARMILGNGLRFNAWNTDKPAIEIDGTHAKYDNIFGSTTIDLRDVKNKNLDFVEVNAIFASTVIFLPKDIVFDIKSNAVFGSVQLPNAKETNFGSDDYTLNNDVANNKRIAIKANAVFGQIKFINKD